MREMKFRAWVDSIVDEETGLYSPSVIQLDSVGNVMKLWTDDNGGYKFKDDTCKFTLQQFTGLTDKNGKEIYEGDWIKANDGIGKVVFIKAMFAMDCGEDVVYALDQISTGKTRCEVVGNIYENEEIL